MKNLKEFKGQKYIIMMLLSIVLCCITVYASEQAVNDATTSGSQQEEVIEQEDELTKMLEEITALKEEVAVMKEELNNVKQLNSKTYIAQKDVNVFAETSSYSELMGTFKSGSVITINTISEDNIWAETDQGYVKMIFITQLDEAKQEALFIKAEPKTEDKVVEEKVEEKESRQQPTEYRTGVTGKSGLSKEDLDYLLAGSRMADCSDEVLEIEAKHNVNAFFTISVAQAETQRGKTGTGKSKNNAFGITDAKNGGYRYFNTLGGSVLEFGGMMERVYISRGRDTISKVHAIYTDSPNWSGNVTTIMNKELAKIKAK